MTATVRRLQEFKTSTGRYNNDSRELRRELGVAKVQAARLRARLELIADVQRALAAVGADTSSGDAEFRGGVSWAARKLKESLPR